MEPPNTTSTESSGVVKLNGVGRLFADSTILHILPEPEDLGSHGAALCGQTAARGWAYEDSLHGDFYCSQCVVELQNLAEKERLGFEDRMYWRTVFRSQSQSTI
jgi:hypothetical protein